MTPRNIHISGMKVINGYNLCLVRMITDLIADIIDVNLQPCSLVVVLVQLLFSSYQAYLHPTFFGM